MKATDQIKRAALNKAIDYLLENPERNVAKIMDMIDKVAPDDVFPTQRAAFHQAIELVSTYHEDSHRHESPGQGPPHQDIHR